MRSDGGEVKYRKQKTRFFQLSADGSTLRWGWKKHVLLFHVDEMECNDDDLSIKLVMTVDRDLIITFPDRSKCVAPPYTLILECHTAGGTCYMLTRFLTLTMFSYERPCLQKVHLGCLAGRRDLLRGAWLSQWHMFVQSLASVCKGRLVSQEVL